MNIRYIVLIFSILFSSCSTYIQSNSDESYAIPEPELSDTSLNSDEIIDTLSLCTFNIQFLGHFKKKDSYALSEILKGYDVVIIQELVAPPYEGNYPDGEPFRPDEDSQAFFDAMTDCGFMYKLSEEDTGTNDEIHDNTSATEWWVIFYKDDRLNVADDIPNGFLAEDRSNHPDYERVPYAFALRTVDSGLDFVLISVHLQPGGSQSNSARRKHEISSISNWINENNQMEHDFIILGDMNIEDSTELNEVLPDGFISLNNECRQTNTLQGARKAKPYDHIMYNIASTGKDIDTVYDCKVVDLLSTMENYWVSDDPYPGNPYRHDTFRQYYSDHHPVIFKMLVRAADDD